MRQFRKNSRKALAAFMSVWLSGIVFLFCCDMSAKASGREFCPLAKAAHGHCNKSKNKNDKNSRLVSDDRARELNYCGFMPAVFDKVRKIERDVQAVQPVDKPVISPQWFAPVNSSSTNPTTHTSFQLVQHKIFIKNRVFRI